MRSIIVLLFISMATLGYSQEILNHGYPDGVYLTKKDFINKRAIKGSLYIEGRDSLAESRMPFFCYFGNSTTQKRLKNVFAISHEGHLYFSNWAVLDPPNRNPDDRGWAASKRRGFTRVQILSKGFLYFEIHLYRKMRAGMAANFHFVDTNDRFRGIVWNENIGMFDIFSGCEDLSKFMETYYPDAKNFCDSKDYTVAELRDVLKAIDP